jgi:hypothetical protein
MISEEQVAFLAARLDEDETSAKLAAREGGTWTQDDPARFPGSISSLGGPVVYDEGAPDENQAPHIVRFDPNRMLRDVAADRQLLAAWQQAEAATPASAWESDYAQALERAVRIRAAVYSDHPDYGKLFG